MHFLKTSIQKNKQRPCLVHGSKYKLEAEGKFNAICECKQLTLESRVAHIEEICNEIYRETLFNDYR